MRRLEVRFQRVERLLKYLEDEEEAENKKYGVSQLRNVISTPIMPRIRQEYEQQKAWITKRVKENREKFAEETVFEMKEEEKVLLGLADSDDRGEKIIAPEAPVVQTKPAIARPASTRRPPIQRSSRFGRGKK